MTKQVEIFRGDMEAVARGYRSGVFGLVKLFVEDLNRSDDPAKVLSAFLGAFAPRTVNWYDGVSYGESEVFPGVEIYFAPDGGDIGVYIGGEQQDYGLGPAAMSVVRRLVAIEEDYNIFWYTAGKLYEELLAKEEEEK